MIPPPEYGKVVQDHRGTSHCKVEGKPLKGHSQCGEGR